jgi:hypothetical protein
MRQSRPWTLGLPATLSLSLESSKLLHENTRCLTLTINPSLSTFSSFYYLIEPKNRIPDLAESSDEDTKRYITMVWFTVYYQVADTVTSIYHITPTALINACTNLSSAKSTILPSLWMRDYRGLFLLFSMMRTIHYYDPYKQEMCVYHPARDFTKEIKALGGACYSFVTPNHIQPQSICASILISLFAFLFLIVTIALFSTVFGRYFSNPPLQSAMTARPLMTW